MPRSGGSEPRRSDSDVRSSSPRRSGASTILPPRRRGGPLNPDFLDILSAFIDERVDFLVVGAYAVSVHAEPRATGDLDLWVEPAPENATRVHRALTSFGAPLDDVGEQDFVTPGTVVQLGVPPRRIDVMTSIDGVSFTEAWSGRVIVELEGLQIPFIGRDALITNKRAMKRPKDRLDLERLEQD